MYKRINVNIFLILFLLIVTGKAYSKNDIHAVRIWPAQEYTRITIESNIPLNNDQMILKNPERVVIDLKGIEINDVIKTPEDRPKSAHISKGTKTHLKDAPTEVKHRAASQRLLV